MTEKADTAELEKRKLENGESEDDDDEDEEDEDEEDEDVISCNTDDSDGKKKKERPLWDKFADIPHEEESISMADTTLIDVSISVLKLAAYLVTFCVVLCGAVSSKLILLLMTSQLAPNRTVTVRRGSLWLNLKVDTMERYLWIWSLMVVYSAPEVGTFIRSIRYVLFKGHINNEMKNRESRKIFLVILAMESLQVIGMALFAFEVLPQIDVIKGVMLTNCVCLVPAILSSLSYDGKDKVEWKKVAPDTLAMILQFSGYVLWPVLGGFENLRLWFIPLSLFLISCGWWMNFVLDKSKFGTIKLLGEIKDSLKENHVILYRHYMWISLLKIAIFAVTAFGILSMQGVDLNDMFGSIKQTFNPNRTMEAFQYQSVAGSIFYFEISKKASYVQTVGINVWQIIGTQILATYLCYGFSKFACKVQISSFSFALPVVLVVPFTIELIIVMTAFRNEDPNAFNSILPNYLFFNSPSIYSTNEIFINEYGYMWVFWLISQTWITLHIWYPKCERLSRTEKLFATPMYSGFLVDQSIALNRRRDKMETKSNNFSTPHIITCTTMWHETKPEMLKMLKSIMRMDQDQCLRESARENLKSYDEETNYYTYESHIFFDDAFEIEERTKNFVMNTFVKDLIGSVNKAVETVYASKSIRIEPPKKMPTPYGGRLTYTLPGQTMLHVHLKDKDKIRHRKRWSQVMYMYYLLGYNLMQKEELSHEEKLSKAENVFILALDGDIDFKPQAVILLVDLMKKNSNLGAACGRIHPVGSGIMVWYQSFEYAIGHWLQKATEHVIGCVLCSPGCFSLFRGRALMADNVMKKYTTKAEEARHYVQYDQGEDRWLCTLLLQRGYRVEYSAASDAYTQCPESFNEFYTQRRRWIPSTMANILELLYNYKQTVIINNDISLMYIVYQMTLMIGTVLGPGTIFLLLVSAFNAAFKIDNFTSLYYNMIPILLYVVICLFMSEKIQLASGLLLSGIYGLIMMAVLVGMVMQISDDGLLAPSTIFLFIVAGEIIIAGILHPQEMYCLIHGPIYFITIPSMYLLLIIYSVCNLNVVTWGTREVKQKKTEEEMEEEKKAVGEAKKQTSFQSILGSFGGKNNKKTEDEGAIEFSLTNLFKCMLCTHPKSNYGEKDLAKINESLSAVSKKLENIERYLDYNSSLGKGIQRSGSKSSIHQGDISSSDGNAPKTSKTDIAPKKEDGNIVKEDIRDDLLNPYWIEDDSLKKSDLVMIDSNEMTFWKELINEYLYPLMKDKEKEDEISKVLKELRDKMVLTFFMLNALFIITVFLLQMNKSKIFLDWPLDARINITITDNKEIQIKKTYLQLEPIGVLFILFFAIILIVQFVAMLFHRFETLCHLLSSSPIILPWKKKKPTFDMKVKVGKKQLLMKEIENKNETSDMLTLEEPSKNKVDIKEMTNSIFSRMKHEEDLETAEKAEKRRTSAFAWAQNKMEALSALKHLEFNRYKTPTKLEQLIEGAEV